MAAAIFAMTENRAPALRTAPPELGILQILGKVIPEHAVAEPGVESQAPDA